MIPSYGNVQVKLQSSRVHNTNTFAWGLAVARNASIWDDSNSRSTVREDGIIPRSRFDKQICRCFEVIRKLHMYMNFPKRKAVLGLNTSSFESNNIHEVGALVFVQKDQVSLPTTRCTVQHAYYIEKRKNNSWCLKFTIVSDKACCLIAHDAQVGTVVSDWEYYDIKSKQLPSKPSYFSLHPQNCLSTAPTYQTM